MKKMILAALAACMCVCLCFGIFAACDDRSGNGEQPAEYTITANNGTGYTVDAPASAKEGDTVTVTVAVTNEDTYVTGVTYNGDECIEADGKYTFTMPAENVTIAVQTGTYEEVLSDGNDLLNANNVYNIAQNGSYSPRVGTDTENVWKILADLSWGNTTAFSRYSGVTSSNQSVIPDNAVTIVELDGHDFGQGSSASNLILAADICIDTTKISVGTTWLTIELDSENTSSNCTFVVKVTVFPYGEVPVILDGIEIPGNVGTMLRMADGAGLDSVFICNRKARLTHPKLIKGSQGAILSVPVYEFESVAACRAWLKMHGFTVYLADTRADKYYFEEPFGVKTALVMGSERYGITREWYDGEYKMIAIPMLGKCDSLNVGVAATVLCYDASIKNKFRSEK